MEKQNYMKTISKYTLGISIFFSLFLAFNLRSQNPGMVISELFINPASTDSCKEYVELLVTQNIDFSLTPYTVIVTNNGSATASGWINGGAITYAFAINSGTVAAGNVVYVGGSCMAPSGTKLRTINVKYTGGDGGIGNPTASGVFGNGGGNADGVALFKSNVANITSSTVPADAVFFGTGIGSASLTTTTGYELPVNDLYSGGKLQGSSFFTFDPASDDIITATGLYNTTTNTWTTPRTFSVTLAAAHTAASSVSLTTSASPASIAFLSNDSTAAESAGSATIYMRLITSSTFSSSVDITATAWSNATASDYTLATTTVTFAAGATVNSTAPVVININNDAIIESSEYVILKMSSPNNANIGIIQQMAFYIKDDDKVVPSPSNAISLNLLASFSNTVAGSNSAEIVTHDPTTQRLYIANSLGAKVDIIDFVNPSSPTLLSSINITPYGNINSVAVRNGIVACAIENTNPQDTGKIVFFDKDGVFLKQVKAGAMPDMICFNHAGTKVITANEGEPNAAYTNDPDGTITVVDISGGIASLTQANVTQIDFLAYNGQEATLRSQGIRIYGGPSPTSSKDFEPEYVSVAKDDSKAWVTLQENNAIVEVNLITNTITAIRALGTKNHSLLNNGFDVSNMTKKINIANFPVKGFYLPDAIASYTVGGINYLITANEGDARAYSGFTEESRVKSVILDPAKFPNASELKNDYVLGRLTITDKFGDNENDGDIDTIYCLGSRSFSIWNAVTGQQVYDSGDDLEQITASNSFSVMFNASNGGSPNPKDRSDDKGPEPEGVTIGEIGGNIYAFIAIERIGGVMVYDITNPNAPIYVTYVNNRSFATNGPDRGTEGIIFIPQSESPNGQHLVVAANETSSTLSIWGIPGCTTPIASTLSVLGGTIGCAGTTTLSVPVGAGLNYQWSVNSSTITGATSNTLAVTGSGDFMVSITGGTNCSTTSLTQSITVNPSPTVSIVSATAICEGQTATLTVSGASTYTWNTSSISTSISVSPTVSTNYSVIGTGTNSCVGTTSMNLVVNSNPTISISPASPTICAAQTITLTTGGASTYSWSTGATTTSVVITPTASTVYSVMGTDVNNCSGTNSVTISVNPNPTVTAVTSNSAICAGQSTTLTVSGANTYSWSVSSSTATSVVVSPGANSTYTVTGSDLNNCKNISVVGVTVNPIPSLNITSSNSLMCVGQTASLTVTGANTYSWNTSATTSVIAISPTLTTTYSVTGTDVNNCSNLMMITQNVSACTSINEVGLAKAISIYPNPAYGFVTIAVKDHSGKIKLEITNTLGQIVYTDHELQNGNNTINISEFSKGLYFINTYSDGERTNTILIVQ